MGDNSGAVQLHRALKGEPMMIGLHHIAILASRRAEPLAFYEALGFVVTETHVRPERNDEIIFMEQAGVVLEVFISAGNPPRVSYPEAYGLRHVAFQVSDAAAMRDELIRKGYAPEELRRDAFTGDAMFFVMDPDGLPIEIHE